MNFFESGGAFHFLVLRFLFFCTFLLKTWLTGVRKLLPGCCHQHVAGLDGRLEVGAGKVEMDLSGSQGGEECCPCVGSACAWRRCVLTAWAQVRARVGRLSDALIRGWGSG